MYARSSTVVKTSYRVTLPFILDGLEAGDKTIHIVDPGRRSDHLERLTSTGIDVAAEEESGQLALLDGSQTFFVDGPFDMERQLAYRGRVIALETFGDLSGQWDAARLAQVVSNLVVRLPRVP